MKILLGVTGSVAATLVPTLVAVLLADGHEVQVVATPRGLYFFDRAQVASKVWTNKDEWPEDGYSRGQRIPHIDLGQWADILVVAPLTADTLSDMANGKCDKFLTNIVQAWPREKSMVVAPAMNSRMWTHPITRIHLNRLKRWYRLRVVGPVEKRLACGEVGIGAMAEIKDIVSVVKELGSQREEK